MKDKSYISEIETACDVLGDKLTALQTAVREFLEAYHTGPSVMEDQLIKRMEELVK